MLEKQLREHSELEICRLLLLPVTMADAKTMFAYTSDIENTKWGFPANQTIEETKNVIENIYLKSPLGRYGIVLKEISEFIGTVDLMNWSDGKEAEIGYIINKKFWGHGLATEASAKILELCFEVLGFEEVHAFCALENPASVRVLTKLGMTEMKRLQNNKKYPGGWVTSQHFCVTKVNYSK